MATRQQHSQLSWSLHIAAQKQHRVYRTFIYCGNSATISQLSIPIPVPVPELYRVHSHSRGNPAGKTGILNSRCTFLHTNSEQCGLQGYGAFVFLWQFFIPLVVFFIAYWKILGVVRRQAKVAAGRRRLTVAPKEPVAGTSGEGTAKTGSSQSKKEAKTGVMADGSRGPVEGQGQSLSSTEINVVRTMVYITVCFTVCWMPMYFNILFKRVTVKYIAK